VQRVLIDRFGGLHGVKDLGMVENCTFAPQATFGGSYLYPDLAAMASAYWYSFTMGHAFTDGNKRVGLSAAQIFLEMNGHDLGISQVLAVEVTLRIASSQMTREEVLSVVQLQR
jgi:death-on-curing protein